MTKYRIALEWYKGKHRCANELFEFKAEDDFAADKMFVDFVRNVMKGLISVWSWDEISELGREKPTFELYKKFPDGKEQTINFLEYEKLAAIYKGNGDTPRPNGRGFSSGISRDQREPLKNLIKH